MDAVAKRFCIDEQRIYATGKSQGGGFVNQLACDAELSTRIAAFAPVSGAYYIQEGVSSEADCTKAIRQTIKFRPCHPGREDVPLLAFHGGNDGVINYTGDYRREACLPSVLHWAEEWADRNGLSPNAAQDPLDGSDNGFVKSFGGGLVTFVYDGDDVGHVWPSMEKNSDNEGRNFQSFNATTLIMDFFREHNL
jgi:poly(3-hydroxybutyrate) depolymerase